MRAVPGTTKPERSRLAACPQPETSGDPDVRWFFSGGRRGKERAASLRAEQRLAAGGPQGSPQGSPEPYRVQTATAKGLPRPVASALHVTSWFRKLRFGQ